MNLAKMLTLAAMVAFAAVVLAGASSASAESGSALLCKNAVKTRN